MGAAIAHWFDRVLFGLPAGDDDALAMLERFAAHLNHPDHPVDWCLATRRMAIAVRLFDLDETWSKEELLGMNRLVQRFGALLV